MSQEKVQRQGGGGDDEANDGAPAGQERREKLGEDVDAILAEDFVRAYVQKGGQ
jgi:ubiquitin-like protein Pup